jgi:hypothetical protein
MSKLVTVYGTNCLKIKDFAGKLLYLKNIRPSRNWPSEKD